MYPSTYWNPEEGLIVLVHGDDFVGVGGRENLGKFREQLGERFGIKTSMQGLGRGRPSKAKC